MESRSNVSSLISKSAAGVFLVGYIHSEMKFTCVEGGGGGVAAGARPPTCNLVLVETVSPS